jgi:4-oxalocrotonate tautomerase
MYVSTSAPELAHARKDANVTTITLTLSGAYPPEQIKRIVDGVISITNSVLQKLLSRTALILRRVSHEDWFIAGRSLAEFHKNSFRVEVTVVDETTTKVQRADYARKIFEHMSKRIDNLHPFSNVHVIDVRGAGYGYGGLTQEFVWHRSDEATFLEVNS